MILAVTLYAIWFEHFINGVLARALERKGYDSNISIPLIKELRLPTKASSLWAIADLPIISDDDLKLLDQVIQFRNAFVHYKWHAYDEQTEDQRRDRLRVTVARASQLVSDLLDIESSIFWNGRETEIIERFHDEVRKRWEENPIEFAVQNADAESEPGSPSSY